ncbi:MAG: 30S ribosomal protein S7 [Gammaproteobacteria bacterium]|nr:30S ribosomal protein S7 [Gammaproteobacteria bacterium]
MSRRTSAPTRVVLPDPKFGSQMLAKFMNMVMEAGKKSAAEKIMYGAIDRISEKTGREGDAALELLSTALENVKPAVEVKSRRVGGATYQVPVEVRPTRRQTLAMRWLIEAARARSEKSMAHRLAHELMDAAENRGTAVRKREDTHRMADANKAFAHYRW